MTSEAAEVAEDYRIALEDLNTNMRFEISNLTVIARENTEHALVIAEALEKHILKVGPIPISRLAHGNRRLTNSTIDRTEQETARALPTRLNC